MWLGDRPAVVELFDGNKPESELQPVAASASTSIGTVRKTGNPNKPILRMAEGMGDSESELDFETYILTRPDKNRAKTFFIERNLQSLLASKTFDFSFAFFIRRRPDPTQFFFVYGAVIRCFQFSGNLAGECFHTVPHGEM
jgi:hypothetical protein